MRILSLSTLLLLAVISFRAPLAAHHSWPVSRQQLVTVTGTVVNVAWSNPHPMFTVDVETQNGGTERWQIGGPAISRMASNGWSATTIKRGDVVTGVGYQFADGQKIVRLERMTLPDGKEMPVYGR